MVAWEPAGSWSAENLAALGGGLEAFRAAYPDLPVRIYDPAGFDLDRALDGVDLAIVHEWNEPELVARIGCVRRRNSQLRLFFHDTHHRSVTDPDGMSRYDLTHYDGVLAFGESVREQYLKRGWANRVWTFHEAADTRVFRPYPSTRAMGDLVWIGNWGDDERTGELREFLIDPVRVLELRARIYGVRYPPSALERLEQAGIEYLGWLPNYLAPRIFSQYRFTVHVPRRPYAEALAGVPTIRVFEALACGIPLISAPWMDSENLFTPGSYLKVRNGEEMGTAMRDVCNDPGLAQNLSARGLEAILARHTCAHRADQLMEIAAA